MVDAWIALSRLNADLLALGARSLDFGWMLLTAGAAWATSAPGFPKADLMALGLDRMPSTREELRRAYRHAAKAAHPDAGGSADAFRAVSEAFERLSERSNARTA
jgi:DnaJ domain